MSSSDLCVILACIINWVMWHQWVCWWKTYWRCLPKAHHFWTPSLPNNKYLHDSQHVAGNKIITGDQWYQSRDQYATVMWSICTSHVINMHQSCDQYAPVMWSMCTVPVMWSICTSHVINVHQWWTSYVINTCMDMWSTYWTYSEMRVYLTLVLLPCGTILPLIMQFLWLPLVGGRTTIQSPRVVFIHLSRRPSWHMHRWQRPPDIGAGLTA